MPIKRINAPNEQMLSAQPRYATFSSSGPNGNALTTVAVQLQNRNRTNIAARAVVPFWVTTESGGDVALTTALSCSLAGGIDGEVIVNDASGPTGGLLVSEADGDIDVQMGDSVAREVFLHLLMPDGSIVSSSSLDVSS